MWILWKMRFQRGEFCKNWDYQYVNFWIKCEFLPQRAWQVFPCLLFSGPWGNGSANGSTDVFDTLPGHQNERNGRISPFEWRPTMCQRLLLVRAQETSWSGPHGGGEDWIGKGTMEKHFFSEQSFNPASKRVYNSYKSLLLTAILPLAFVPLQKFFALKTKTLVILSFRV